MIGWSPGPRSTKWRRRTSENGRVRKKKTSRRRRRADYKGAGIPSERMRHETRKTTTQSEKKLIYPRERGRRRRWWWAQHRAVMNAMKRWTRRGGEKCEDYNVMLCLENNYFISRDCVIMLWNRERPTRLEEIGKQLRPARIRSDAMRSKPIKRSSLFSTMSLVMPNGCRSSNRNDINWALTLILVNWAVTDGWQWAKKARKHFRT